MNKLIIAAAACLLTGAAWGQKKTGATPLPGNSLLTRQVERKVYIVDTTQYYYMKLRPEGTDTTLTEFLYQRIKKGQLAAYADKSNLSTPMTTAQLMAVMRRTDTIELDDPVTGANMKKVTIFDFNFEDVIYYSVLEEWRYDKQRGTTDIQIVAIAPVQQLHDDHGPTGLRVLYWMKYADVKKYLAAYQTEHPNTNLPLAVWNQYFTQKPVKH